MNHSRMDSGDVIAANLARLISEKGTNNRHVAEAAGLGHTAVRDIITRKVRNPTYATLLRLAEVLGVDVSEIVAGAALVAPSPVPVAGVVGPGAQVPLVDFCEKANALYKVACPPQLPADHLVAVEVGGGLHGADVSTGPHAFLHQGNARRH